MANWYVCMYGLDLIDSDWFSMLSTVRRMSKVDRIDLNEKLTQLKFTR